MVFHRGGPLWKTLCFQPLEMHSRVGCGDGAYSRREVEGMKQRRACPTSFGAAWMHRHMWWSIELKTTLVPQAEGRYIYV